MKFKFILSSALLLGSVTAVMAQTHKEGEEYYKADQFANAKELLQRNMNNAGTDKAVSNYYLGLIALKDGDSKQAANYFNEGLKANPDYGFNYVGLGAIALKNGNKSEAEKYFKDGSKVQGKNASLQIAIARAYYEADPVAYAKEIDNYVNKAKKDSEKIKDNGVEIAVNPDIYLFEGDRQKDMKEYGKAAGQYEMATTYDPDAAEAYVKYANLFTQVNQQFAIDMLNKLLNINPGSALAQRELANAYYNAGKFKEAAEEYDTYVKNPNHFKQDEDRYAFLLFYGGDFKNGYDYATKLLSENPNNFTAQRYQFINASQLDEMKDKRLQLADNLVKAHKGNPDNKFAQLDYILIGDELLTADRPQDAQALFEEAIASDPENPEYYKQMAMVYVREKDFAKAADVYGNYIEKKSEPGYNDIVQQARYAYYAGASNLIENPQLAQQYLTQASDIADKAIQISSDYPTPFIIKGQSAIASAPSDEDRLSAGVPYYTQAIQIIESGKDPSRYASDLKDMYTYMGNYYLRQLKDTDTAIDYFNKYLELAPDDQPTRDYVNSLKK